MAETETSWFKVDKAIFFFGARNKKPKDETIKK